MVANSKMIFREKTHIDPYFNKNRKLTLFARLINAYGVAWDVVRWYCKF